MLHGRRHAADELHGGVDCALERGGQRGPVGGALGRHAQLAERVARVRVPPARVPPRHEVVVHERSQQPAVAAVNNILKVNINQINAHINLYFEERMYF